MNSLLILILLASSCRGPDELTSMRVVAELDLGEIREITLANAETVRLELLGIDLERDSLRNAVRKANVRIRVDGEELILGSGTYNLPVETGIVQIDCPVVKGYYSNSDRDHWALTGDARFRLWAAGSFLMEPGTFVYPVKQTWFASMTQSGNEPAYVDWGEDPDTKQIYYHAGHDIGGAEGMDEIVSAMDGMVISAHGDTLEGYTDFPGDIRSDVVWILTDLGWYNRYSHLDSILPDIRPGIRLKKGRQIGYMGKQGHSGGWVHLHFELINKETATSQWGTEEAYPYLMEAYAHQYDPGVIAVARPHQLVWTEEQCTLDGSRSRSFNGDIITYQWFFSDGSSAEGAIQKRSYFRPGEYSEILKVTDSEGNSNYDFAVIQVCDRENPGRPIPVLHAAYYPSVDIKVNDPVTFLVRTFNVETGQETWDFGDGSPTVSVRSEPPDRQNYTEGKYAETIHSFTKPGDYIVKVERSNSDGITASSHLHVVVRE